MLDSVPATQKIVSHHVAITVEMWAARLCFAVSPLQRMPATAGKTVPRQGFQTNVHFR
jgi:hypothetical protein